jgi:hypothetical protein
MVCLFAAPAAWLAHLLVSYLLVPVACRQDTNLLLHLTTVVTAAAAVGGGAIAARTWRERREEGAGLTFVALTGLAMSPFFLLIILVGGASPLFIDPCAG